MLSPRLRLPSSFRRAYPSCACPCRSSPLIERCLALCGARVTALRCVAVLALHGFYEKPGFVHYLEYLLYWKRPEYAKFLMYPHALTFLGFLQDEGYRARVGRRPHLQFVVFPMANTERLAWWRCPLARLLPACVRLPALCAGCLGCSHKSCEIRRLFNRLSGSSSVIGCMLPTTSHPCSRTQEGQRDRTQVPAMESQSCDVHEWTLHASFIASATQLCWHLSRAA